MMQILKGLVEELGKTIIIVLHDINMMVSMQMKLMPSKTDKFSKGSTSNHAG